MIFHRSMDSVTLHHKSREAFVAKVGLSAVNDLEAIVSRILKGQGAGPGDPVSMELIVDLSAQLHDSAARALDEFDNEVLMSGIEVSSRELDRALTSLKETVAQYSPEPTRYRDLGGNSKSLDAALEELRIAWEAYLDNLSIALDGPNAHSADSLAVFTLWFWFILGLGTLLGAGYLNTIRHDFMQRVARQKAENEADFLAYYDPTTGLANRFHFNDKLSSQIVSRQPFSIILVDIDSFREFNERFGHFSGDVVIKEVAFRISSFALGFCGFAARLSSDDFAVLLPGDCDANLEDISSRLSFECGQPVSRAGQVLQISVSMGCLSSESISGSDGLSNELLMRLAGFALATARAKGTGHVVHLDEKLESYYFFRSSISSCLPRALANNWLQVYFQPQISVSEHAVYGFEALVRWEWKGRQISPVELFDLAEEIGLVAQVDQYVLEHTIKTIAAWNQSHRTSYSVSVNVSALHFAEPETINFIITCLGRYRLSPSLLTIEITGSAELALDKDTLGAIKVLQDVGCRVAIDGFGYGYSSLAYLRNLGVDEIKIDQSFAAEVETSSSACDVLGTILSLSSSLGYSSVVGGVETREQAAIVKCLGAKQVQGFFYGKPRPALEWLADTTYSSKSKRAKGGAEPAFL
jgi:diguanylate cyclase (GGDEF)-like protein